MSKKINICLCTYRRPKLATTLESLSIQELPDNVIVSVIVADNDETDSARKIVEDYVASSQMDIKYVHSPKQNISIARNACLDNVDIDADWIAFIDDDEVATPDWLANLLKHADETKADVVFGPVFAQYPKSVPSWIREGNYHSTIAIRRNGVVQTGHTGNTLMNWKRNDFHTQRFMLNRGCSGGEDTEYFFRLWRLGAKLEICENAIVLESVDPERLSFEWIKKRKFRSGQTYAYHGVENLISRLRLGTISACKVIYCYTYAAMKLADESENKFWRLRGNFHIGVLSGLCNVTEKKFY